MILVDTSIWVDHFRRRNAALAAQLEHGQVLIHPFIIGELACGHLSRRGEILSMLADLPQVLIAEHDEVLELIERYRLAGRSIGWIDCHLLASSRLAGITLWTQDRKLHAVNEQLAS